MLWSLAPFGLGAWVPLVAGLKARRRGWVALGVVFCAPVLVGWLGSGVLDDDLEVALVSIPWLAAIATTVAIYPAYRRERALIEELERQEWDREGVRIRRRAEIELRERD